jgi:hypothetical protein
MRQIVGSPGLFHAFAESVVAVVRDDARHIHFREPPVGSVRVFGVAVVRQIAGVIVGVAFRGSGAGRLGQPVACGLDRVGIAA